MQTVGSSGDYSQYVVGNTEGFTRTFTEAIIDVGNFSSQTPNYIQLLIQNGGTVAFTQSNASMAVTSPFTKTTVTGSGSQLLLNSGSNQEFVFFRNGGVGDRVLEVLNGGFADINELETQVAGTLNIDGVGSTVFVEKALVFSNSATLDVSITGGGLWNISSLGSDAASINVTIDASSTMRVRGALDLARFSSLGMATGGTLKVDGLLSNGTVASGTIDLTGGGSIGSGVTLNGGEIKAAAFAATNLTFTSGTLTATGAVTDLNALGAGSTVILDGGNWSPASNINAVNLTIKNGASATVQDGYDGSNLTLIDGSLTVNGDVSNLPTIQSNAHVTLDGDGELLTSVTLDGGTLEGRNFNLGSNLTLTSGTLTVTGTLQNLSELPAGTTVNMSGASADLLLSNTLSITGGTINVSNGASVTVMANVSLGAGAINFGTAGGSISLSGGVFNVASMDNALSLNANASLTGYGTIYGGINLGATGDEGFIDGDAANGGMLIYGDISGSGAISDASVFGNISIGSSPGSLTLQNVDLGNSKILLEIEGSNAGEFDTLQIDSLSDVSGATLSVVFLEGLSVNTTDSWNLVSGGVNLFAFDTLNTPEGWTINENGTFYAVPEQASTTTFISVTAVCLLFIYRRSNYRRSSKAKAC